MSGTRSDFHRTLGRLAKTNAPPSAQDAAFIRETVGDIDKKSAEVRSRIQALEATLQDLDYERRFFSPMLSPIRRMPLEVLGEIFIIALDTSFSPQGMLARICRVCKSWREAAHLVPKLWTTTIVNPFARDLSYESVQTWIGHSRGLPRTIEVYSRKCAGGDMGCLGEIDMCLFSKPVLAKILLTTPSLEKVEIQCPTPQCFINLATSIDSSPYSNTWNSVREVSVFGYGWESKWQNVPSCSFQQLFPTSLRKFNLHLPWKDSIGVSTADLEVHVPPTIFKRLSSITLSLDWSAKHIFGVLQHCTNLEALELSAGGSDLKWRSQDAFVQNIKGHGLSLPKLRKITLENVDILFMRRLQCLTAHALLDVDVRFGDEDWSPEETNENDNEITMAVAPAFSTFLRGGRGSPSTSLPNLSRLTLDNAVFDDDVFARLMAGDCLPNLRIVKLLRLHVNPEKLVGLHEFVDKRGIELKTTRCVDVDCEGAD
ncbi:hypothetical protein NMY22_g15931 [Coprinellus aureogranulatus]|nr:hypothetical protein NMY22_g15931 [Coprinellus aureogranulatus]